MRDRSCELIVTRIYAIGEFQKVNTGNKFKFQTVLNKKQQRTVPCTSKKKHANTYGPPVLVHPVYIAYATCNTPKALKISSLPPNRI